MDYLLRTLQRLKWYLVSGCESGDIKSGDISCWGRVKAGGGGGFAAEQTHTCFRNDQKEGRDVQLHQAVTRQSIEMPTKC